MYTMRLMNRIELLPEVVLPGFVDGHVHLREPGATEKEDLETGTRAALGGGVVMVIDMVNNPGARTAQPERVDEKEARAMGRIFSDLGLHYGHQPEDDNIGTFEIVAPRVCGLKSMLEISTGSDVQTPPSKFQPGWGRWHEVAKPTQPIILHAETETIEEALWIAAKKIGHPTHVAHVSNEAELRAVIEAKEKGWPVTCEATPHHLWFTEEDVINWYFRMKPFIGTERDRDYLRQNKRYIDTIATDHAPHTFKEKEDANRLNPDALTGPKDVKSFGVPGLDTLLPMSMQAIREGWLTPDELIAMTSTNPRRIFGLPDASPDERVVVQTKEYEFGAEDVRSKCGWSPFIGRIASGRVVQVVRGDRVLYDHGTFAAPSGRVVHPNLNAA